MTRYLPWRSDASIRLLFSIAFAVALSQESLYFANQNTKYLHGAAAAGYGWLANDWMAHTIDPLPVFSVLVKWLFELGVPELSYAIFALLAVVWAWSLTSIVRSAGLIQAATHARRDVHGGAHPHAGRLREMAARSRQPVPARPLPAARGFRRPADRRDRPVPQGSNGGRHRPGRLCVRGALRLPADHRRLHPGVHRGRDGTLAAHLETRGLPDAARTRVARTACDPAARARNADLTRDLAARAGHPRGAHTGTHGCRTVVRLARPRRVSR